MHNRAKGSFIVWLLGGSGTSDSESREWAVVPYCGWRAGGGQGSLKEEQRERDARRQRSGWGRGGVSEERCHGWRKEGWGRRVNRHPERGHKKHRCRRMCNEIDCFASVGVARERKEIILQSRMLFWIILHPQHIGWLVTWL